MFQLKAEGRKKQTKSVLERNEGWTLKRGKFQSSIWKNFCGVIVVKTQNLFLKTKLVNSLL